MRQILMLTLLVLATIVTVTGTYHYSYQGTALTGERCAADRDCQLPLSYAARSSCPFMAKCISTKCAVTCLAPEIAQDVPIYRPVCQRDSDCNCSSFYSGQDIISCSCLDGKCHAVVAQ
jgi:hypothetical protein